MYIRLATSKFLLEYGSKICCGRTYASSPKITNDRGVPLSSLGNGLEAEILKFFPSNVTKVRILKDVSVTRCTICSYIYAKEAVVWDV
jgi:hypothetical protein